MSKEDLGPLPRIHSRERRCLDADLELSRAITEIATKHELTTVEELRLVNSTLSNHIGGILKFALRKERHGNTDKPGGLT